MSKAQPITVIARYALKRNKQYTGVVCYLMKSSKWTPSNQATYCVTYANGRATGCTCESRRPCKHRSHVEQVEQERAQREHKAREESPLARKRFDLLRAS